MNRKAFPLWFLFCLLFSITFYALAQTNIIATNSPATNSVPGIITTGPTFNLNVTTLLLTLIPVLVPLIVALGKMILPNVPSWLLPILAPALGALINYLGSLATNTAANPVLALALGSAGVGLREILDQAKQALPPSKPSGGTVVAGSVVILILAFLGFSGCTTSQQTTTYNTLFTLEGVTTTGIDYYDGLVIKGVIATNSVPAVSQAYDVFQSGMTAALNLVAGNSNSVAPPALVVQSQTVLNLIINQTQGH